MEQAKASLQLALTTLSPHDRYNIIAFNSDYRSYSTHPQPATGTNLRGAQAFVDRLHAHGGTEMYTPLDAVLSEPAAEGFLKQVVFITDGSVGNEGALFQLIEQKLHQARLFTVGIGSAPNSFFMRKSAQFGRGTFTHVGNLAEVSEKMSALFRQLQTPRLQDIQVSWPDGFSAEAYPTRSPDLYHGQPLLIKAKLTHRQSAQGAVKHSRSASDGSITVSGLSASGPWSRTLSVPALKERPTDHQNPAGKGVGSLWGRAKISALMDQKHTGVPEADIKPQVLEVALTHQLLSAYTSFIARDKTPARPPETTLKATSVPNLVAKGQTPMPHTLLSTQPHSPAQYSPHSYPQTALGLNGLLWMGTLSALLALLLMTAGKLLMIPPEWFLRAGSFVQPSPQTASQPASQHALQGPSQDVKAPNP
ncbi:hypothetical protein [Pseudomaricurvus hydrocarbonicus]